MRREVIFLGIVLVVIGATLYGFMTAQGDNPFLRLFHRGRQIALVTIGGTTVSAEVASTDKDREQGLSGRDALANGAGMLFQFDAPGRYGIWMQGMRFPIDIIWIRDGKVVFTVENVSPPALGSTPVIYTPNEPATQVLEVAAGFTSQHNIGPGSSVTIKFDGFSG